MTAENIKRPIDIVRISSTKNLRPAPRNNLINV